jgi:hypothetical protein
MGVDSFLTKVSAVLWPRLLPLLRPMRYEANETICKQEDDCIEMYILLSGRLLGSTVVEGEEYARLRHTASGGHFNVLCVLGVWKKVNKKNTLLLAHHCS